MKRKRKSLQKIEDSYINKGYKGYDLRKILEKDNEYKNLLKKKKEKLTKKFKVSISEDKKYVLSTDIDFEILKKCKKIEKLELTKQDRLLIRLIKSQLKDDWRSPLLKILNKIVRKYN